MGAKYSSLVWYLVAVIGVNDGESGNKSSFNYMQFLLCALLWRSLFWKGDLYSQNQFLVEPFHLNTS